MEQLHLVILPGWGMEKAVFQPFITSLSGWASVTVVEWKKIHEESEFSKRALDTVDLIEGPIVLLGWSLGSLVAFEYASMHPGNVKGLIIMGGTSCFTNNQHYTGGWDPIVIQRMKRRLHKDKEGTLAAFYESMFSATEKEFYHQFSEIVQSEWSGDDTESLLTGLDYLLHKDMSLHLDEISVPCLVIHGTDDLICPIYSALFIREKCKNQLHLSMMEETGHIPFFTKPSECVQLLSQFIQEEVKI
ncbi:alpha/beta fold hydrolase [Ectobacillus polymachus]|uniref:alpha/beta fold hydrolase n=1 Tax=Ectobacillus polymachus TaxID=1508806 RepID=UPI003A8C1C41